MPRRWDSGRRSTRVPPVTELKSPPASRITGADSPVMALSSTEATPTTTSPSQGMISPAATWTRSPLRNWSALTRCVLAPYCGWLSLLAHTVCCRPRRLAAWALLRPSASASAKLAKSRVNQSQRLRLTTNQRGSDGCGAGVNHWLRPTRVVMTLPSQTTNITGLRHWQRGSSLRMASRQA